LGRLPGGLDSWLSLAIVCEPALIRLPRADVAGEGPALPAPEPLAAPQSAGM